MYNVDKLVDIAKMNASESGMTTTITIVVAPGEDIHMSLQETWTVRNSSPKPEAPKPVAADPAPLTPPAPKPQAVAPKPEPVAPKPALSEPKPAPVLPVEPGRFDLSSIKLPDIVAVVPKPKPSASLDDDDVLPVRGHTLPMSNDPAVDPYFLDLREVVTDVSVCEGDTIELDSVFQGFSLEVIEVEDSILVVSPSHELAGMDDEETCSALQTALFKEGYGSWEVLLN